MSDDREIQDALYDSAWLAGLQAGWNFGIMENREGMELAQKSRAGYLRPITDKRRTKKREIQEPVQK